MNAVLACFDGGREDCRLMFIPAPPPLTVKLQPEATLEGRASFNCYDFGDVIAIINRDEITYKLCCYQYAAHYVLNDEQIEFCRRRGPC